MTKTQATTAQTNAPATMNPVDAAVPLNAMNANESSPTHTRHAATSSISTLKGIYEVIKDHGLSRV